MLIKENTKIFFFFCILGETRSGKCLQFEICVKTEFCTENFGGRDTSFTLKGLIICTLYGLSNRITARHSPQRYSNSTHNVHRVLKPLVSPRVHSVTVCVCKYVCTCATRVPHIVPCMEVYKLQTVDSRDFSYLERPVNSLWSTIERNFVPSFPCGACVQRYSTLREHAWVYRYCYVNSISPRFAE